MNAEIISGVIFVVVVFSIPDSMSKDIQKSCQSVYPIHEVYIRKVKCLKKPKVDVGKLMEMHGEGGTTVTTTATGAADAGTKIVRDSFEPPVQEEV